MDDVGAFLGLCFSGFMIVWAVNQVLKILPITLLSRGPRLLLILFVSFVTISVWLLGRAAESDVVRRIHFRDTSTRSFAVVKSHNVYAGSKSKSYYVDYSYIPNVDKNPITSKNHELSDGDYDKYPVGSKIPIRYDPTNISDTHLDLGGYDSNSSIIAKSLITMAVELFPIIFVLYLIFGGIGAAFKNNGDSMAASSASSPAEAHGINMKEGGSADALVGVKRRAPDLALFLVLGSVAVTMLIVAPMLWWGISTPGKPILSPPMVLWIAGVILGWCAIVIIKSRRLRRNLRQG